MRGISVGALFWLLSIAGCGSGASSPPGDEGTAGGAGGAGNASSGGASGQSSAGGRIAGGGGVVGGGGGVVGGGTGGSGIAGSGAGGAMSTPRPAGVLLFWGMGGYSPAGLSYGTLNAAAALYAAAGLVVDYTDVWPTTVATYRLIVLVRQGDDSETVRFSDGQLADMAAFLGSGGVLVVAGEGHTLMSWAPFDDLLLRLGSSMRSTGTFTWPSLSAELFSDITQHELTAGVAVLSAGAAEAIEPGTGTCLFTPSLCIGAVERLAGGQLVVLGDGNLIDDSALEIETRPTDNRRFVANLAGVAP